MVLPSRNNYAYKQNPIAVTNASPRGKNSNDLVERGLVTIICKNKNSDEPKVPLTTRTASATITTTKRTRSKISSVCSTNLRNHHLNQIRIHDVNQENDDGDKIKENDTHKKKRNTQHLNSYSNDCERKLYLKCERFAPIPLKTFGEHYGEKNWQSTSLREDSEYNGSQESSARLKLFPASNIERARGICLASAFGDLPKSPTESSPISSGRLNQKSKRPKPTPPIRTVSLTTTKRPINGRDKEEKIGKGTVINKKDLTPGNVIALDLIEKKIKEFPKNKPKCFTDEIQKYKNPNKSLELILKDFRKGNRKNFQEEERRERRNENATLKNRLTYEEGGVTVNVTDTIRRRVFPWEATQKENNLIKIEVRNFFFSYT